MAFFWLSACPFHKEYNVVGRTTNPFTILYQGKFNSLYVVKTAAGAREVIAHNEGNRTAAKMMAIVLNPGVKLVQEDKPTNTLSSFLATLRRTGLQNLSTFFLAVDRPAAYFRYPFPLAATYQLEIPGGMGEGNESPAATARRELVQEYGLASERDVIQTAPLVDLPGSHDGGAHAELYSLHVALVDKPPQPSQREGIIPGKCWFGPLPKAQQYLDDQRRARVMIDLLTQTAVSHLGLALHGGWAALS